MRKLDLLQASKYDGTSWHVCPITKLSITGENPDRYSNETPRLKGDHAKTAGDRGESICSARVVTDLVQ